MCYSKINILDLCDAMIVLGDIAQSLRNTTWYKYEGTRKTVPTHLGSTCGHIYNALYEKESRLSCVYYVFIIIVS